MTKLYNVTPHDHISIEKPLYVSSPLAISGHWNAGVPKIIFSISKRRKR